MAASQFKTTQFRTPSETNIPWLNIQRHPDGTIKKPDQLENQLKDPELASDSSNKLDRVQGSLLGLALGDAVGAHVEFRPREFFKNNRVRTLVGGGTWGLEKGQFTDDTSMALCLASSLIVKGDFVPYDQLVRYKWWFREGYMSSTGKCFDIGAATRKALEQFEYRQQVFAEKHKIPPEKIDFLSDSDLLHKFNVDCSKKDVAGNGALMRLAPVPLFFYRYPEHAIEFSEISARITHGDQRALDACRYYGALIVAALNGEPKKDLLARDFYKKHEHWFDKRPLHPEIMEIAEGSYKTADYEAKDIHGKGFVVQSIEAALWAFYSDEDTFKRGVLKAVNLGDDTDTTAAIYGQLAGACYGYEKLPEDWRKQIYAEKFLKCVCKWIVYKGRMWQPSQMQMVLPMSPTRVIQILRTCSVPYVEKSDSNTDTSFRKPKSATSMKTSTQGANLLLDTNAFRNGRRNSTQQLSNGNIPSSGQTTSKNPAGKLDPDVDFSASIDYFLAKVETPKDIGRWIQLLGKEFSVYENIFEENNVDRYWFLNHLNHETLQQYGMTNKIHQDRLLTHIERLKIDLDLGKLLQTTK